jgi:uncharacterized lipoprotein YddW (UPF0748 family)
MMLTAGIVAVAAGTSSVRAEPIRGVWVTNSGSEALYSEANVRETVRLCKAKKINTLFVVVWNGGKTVYPSKLVESMIGVRQHEKFGGFDPLKAIVREGHRAGLKVHAWFEFGFAYGYGSSKSAWTDKFPDWTARNAKGEPLNKNNSFWWSAIHPGPQRFLRDLVNEVISNYDVDGIQGDDRMPAMPAEGGYEDYAASLYRRQTGRELPSKHDDPDWLQWKADKLTEFGKALYQDVKSTRPDCIVSWAPSIYPWSKEQYLQDWPKWLREGYADYVFPQLYRYDLPAYERILKELTSHPWAGATESARSFSSPKFGSTGSTASAAKCSSTSRRFGKRAGFISRATAGSRPAELSNSAA